MQERAVLGSGATPTTRGVGTAFTAVRGQGQGLSLHLWATESRDADREGGSQRSGAMVDEPLGE